MPFKAGMLVLLIATSLAGCRLKKSQEAEPQKDQAPPVDPLQPTPDAKHLETPPGAAPATYKVRFETSQGDFVVQVHRQWAPRGADRFYELVKSGFYDGNRFFRVLSGFAAQWGINGDPSVQARWRTRVIPDDRPNPEVSNTPGTITFATSGRDSRTTQVFINLGDNSRLDRMGFTPFGKVTNGMSVVRSLYSGYGEGAPDGRGPSQPLIERRGNDYLNSRFPKLDYIKKAVLIEPEKKAEKKPVDSKENGKKSPDTKSP